VTRAGEETKKKGFSGELHEKKLTKPFRTRMILLMVNVFVSTVKSTFRKWVKHTEKYGGERKKKEMKKKKRKEFCEYFLHLPAEIRLSQTQEAILQRKDTHKPPCTLGLEMKRFRTIGKWQFSFTIECTIGIALNQFFQIHLKGVVEWKVGLNANAFDSRRDS
jgi:hypothetical protein